MRKQTDTSNHSSGKRNIGSWFKRINAGLNHDFCPDLNRYVYWLKQPIGWVTCGAVFSAMVGFLLGSQGFVLMWSFLSLLVVGGAWPWLSMKRIGCKLVFDRTRTQESGLATATIEITNRWPVPIFGLMVEGEFLLDLLDDDQVALGLKRVPGWSVTRFSWEFEPKRRGILPVDEPQLTNGFPFGIYRCRKPVEVAQRAIVWPLDCDLQDSPGLDGTQFNIAGMLSDRSGFDGDSIGVRQYRQGDSLKHVHWPKTAALGRLIVQERQTHAQRTFEVILDLSPKHHCGAGSQSTYEWAIRIATSICRQLHRHQAKIVLTCQGLSDDLRNQISNTNGIGPLLDFAAKLPQWNEVKNSKFVQNRTTSMNLEPAQTFLVCTDRSPIHSSNSNRQMVVINWEQFKTDIGFADQPIPSPIVPGIQITSPALAPAELRTGWQRGVCHGN